jgi:hypothetical protein
MRKYTYQYTAWLNAGGLPLFLLLLDGYSPGWVRIDTSRLASIHISSFKKRSEKRKASYKEAPA